MGMSRQQQEADRRERAEQAAEFLRRGDDVLFEISQDLLLARRTYDSICKGNNNSPEAIDNFMEHLAAVGTVVDDVLTELYEFMEDPQNPTSVGYGGTDVEFRELLE